MPRVPGYQSGDSSHFVRAETPFCCLVSRLAPMQAGSGFAGTRTMAPGDEIPSIHTFQQSRNPGGYRAKSRLPLNRADSCGVGQKNCSLHPSFYGALCRVLSGDSLPYLHGAQVASSRLPGQIRSSSVSVGLTDYSQGGIRSVHYGLEKETGLTQNGEKRATRHNYRVTLRS